MSSSATCATLLFHSVFGSVYSSLSFATIFAITLSSVKLMIWYLNASSLLNIMSPRIGGFLNMVSNDSSGKCCFLLIEIILLIIRVLFTVISTTSSVGSMNVSLWSPSRTPRSASSNPVTFPLSPRINVYTPFT